MPAAVVGMEWLCNDLCLVVVDRAGTVLLLDACLQPLSWLYNGRSPASRLQYIATILARSSMAGCTLFTCWIC